MPIVMDAQPNIEVRFSTTTRT